MNKLKSRWGEEGNAKDEKYIPGESAERCKLGSKLRMKFLNKGWKVLEKKGSVCPSAFLFENVFSPLSVFSEFITIVHLLLVHFTT